MKDFIGVAFDPVRSKAELVELGVLLQSGANLSESKDIQPFFKARHQLTAFLGTFAANVGPGNWIAYEFPIFGDFATDIVVGNKEQGAYCLIELEDAKPQSIFARVRGKSTKQWGQRFEHGFSQLVDWFYALDDQKNTQRFAKDFGPGHISFTGLLIIGRSAALSESDRHRLQWRMEKVSVNSHDVYCLTFDDVYEWLSWRIGHYLAGSTRE